MGAREKNHLSGSNGQDATPTLENRSFYKPAEQDMDAKLYRELELSNSYAEGLIETDTQRHGDSPPDNASAISWLALSSHLA